MGEFLERWWPSLAGVVLLILAGLLLWPDSPEQSIRPEVAAVSQTPTQTPAGETRAAELERQKALDDARRRVALEEAARQRSTTPEVEPAPGDASPSRDIGQTVTFTQDSPDVRRTLRLVEVELYETSWCQYCRKTRAFLDRSGISYRAYDVEADETAKLRRDRFAPGSGVPVTVIDGEAVRGFSEQSLNAAFQNAVERRLAAR